MRDQGVRPTNTASGVIHDVEDAIRHIVAIVYLGQLREDAFQRGLAHEFAKAFNRVVRHHLARAQDQDRGADLFNDLKDVGTIKDDFPLAGQGAQQGAQHQPAGHVQAGERLVQDEDIRVVQQGGGEQNLLAHALRIRGERRMAVIPERECPKEFVHLRFQNAARHAAKPAHQLQILPAAKMRVEVSLLGHVADAPLERGEILVHASSAVEDLAIRRLDEPGQHFDRGAFSGSVGTQVPEDFARLNGKADLADGCGVAVILRQRPGFQHFMTPRPSASDPFWRGSRRPGPPAAGTRHATRGCRVW